MQDPAAFERFVRGISTEMPPFDITEIAKIDDYGFDVFLDVKRENRASWGLGEIGDAETGGHDLHTLITYSTKFSILSMTVLTETGISPAGYGWSLQIVNTINRARNGYISKVFLAEPEANQTESMDLMVAWEMDLHDPSLLEGEGLEALKALIHRTILRLCTEAVMFSAELTGMFETEFPSGKLDS